MALTSDWTGKVAVVTGGASGLGRGLASQFKRLGMQVVIADVERSALEQTQDALGVTGIQVDVTDYDSVQSLADQVAARFGPVHVLCNNAGVGSMGSIADTTISDWRWMLNVNLWGVIHGIQAFLPSMRASADGGFIINTASMGGLRGARDIGAYCAAKFGVVALTEALAAELKAEASRVRVSVLCPGPIRSNIAASSRNRPTDGAPAGLKDRSLEDYFATDAIAYMDPEDVAERVIEAVASDELYIISHPHLFAPVQARHDAIAQAAARAAERAKPLGARTQAS